ncbi:MAG TPA: bifunctional 5,10-methylenetetrahydrofolate dehydrogenase/5,10-methenyltetrahydrofolate cyclohydrolase [Patescibacteria group bacterium]|nr:bifunctional 5,10-methylenetetrahydrofolate dehydrogenase/5,10-methenyltetrahydrofolate cyclohydrolase [Patescibacteria group bacterium]
MKIDGKAIAEDMLRSLALQVEELKNRGVTPTLAVVMIGDNPANLAYIKQKQKAAERIGARLILNHESRIMNHEIQQIIDSYNKDPKIHGVIVQRPVPEGIGEYHVTSEKDVDGFESHSPFDVPVAMAVWKCIESTGQKPKKFVVIGRGETAGAPIARYLENKQCATSIIHSKTPGPQEIMKHADCIISCVGKERVVIPEAITPGVIVIGVGIWRDTEGKLRGDYNEEEIENIASYYTPTPGGVGPVNVACLMQNLVAASTK